MLDRILIGSSAEPTDPYFANVSLLLHGDGSNGAQNNTFIDSSVNNFTITRNGNTTQGSFSKFNTAPYSTTTNGGSAYFDGSGDYLTAPDNAALQLGSSNFTIEFWVNFSVVPGAAQGAALVSKFDTSNTGYEVILYNNTMYFQAQSANIGMTYAFTPTAGTWYHIAWTRSGANSYGFINGALVASTSAASGSITNLAQALQIGRRGDNTLYLNGYMSNIRVVKGTAVYTAAFTPPTAPVTAITNTSLLLNATNAAIFDNSMKNDLETVGNAQISTSVKKFGTGSMAFDGTGDWLQLPSTSELSFGTGNFTIEMWMYAQNLASIPMLFHKGSSGSNGWFFQTSASTLYFGQLDSARYSTWSVSLSNNTWYHIALTRVGSTLNVFINGVSQTAQTVSGADTSNDNTSPALIGVIAGGTYALQGYLDDYRITKGVARYTANFTPPTAAFPNK